MYVSLLNFPEDMRRSLGGTMIVGIVPPTVKNGKRGGEPDIDAYLEVFVDELIQMGDTSLLLSHKRAPFDVKVRLVLFLLDFPGMAKVFHQNQQNAYRCCPTCKHEGCQIAPLNKMTYMEVCFLNLSYL